jgi:hypothetical protein
MGQLFQRAENNPILRGGRLFRRQQCDNLESVSRVARQWEIPRSH